MAGSIMQRKSKAAIHSNNAVINQRSSSNNNNMKMGSLTMMGQLNCFAFVGVAVMAVLSHLKAMMTDPGAVPPDAKPVLSAEELAALEQSEKSPSLKPEEVNNRPSSPTSGLQEGGITMSSVAAAGAGAAVAAVAASLPTKPVTPAGPAGKGRRLCRRCNSFKPQRAHHCSICKRCIVKMDHHCPWWSVVTSRLTHIDRLKGETSSSMNGRFKKSSGLNEVFGIGRKLGSNRQDSFRADWLSPFVSACFPSSMRDEIMGFCRPCGGRSSQDSDVEMPNRNRMVRSVDEIV
eukprot:scaffold19579_cov52-Attheya_sp.AAC.5